MRMASLGTMSIDRRAEYYQRVAPLIAKDPLDFYARAERGRQLLATYFQVKQPEKKETCE